MGSMRSFFVVLLIAALAVAAGCGGEPTVSMEGSDGAKTEHDSAVFSAESSVNVSWGGVDNGSGLATMSMTITPANDMTLNGGRIIVSPDTSDLSGSIDFSVEPGDYYLQLWAEGCSWSVDVTAE